MTVLESALESAKRGKGRAVGLVVGPGVGKSRLCFEFAERCRAAEVVVQQGSGVPHGRNIPLLPILEIFRAYFGISEREAHGLYAKIGAARHARRIADEVARA